MIENLAGGHCTALGLPATVPAMSMMKRVSTLSWCWVFGCFLLGALRVWSQPVAPTNSVQPTLTVAMGDLGGKFFGQIPDATKTRHYYIAAEPQLWDYAPQGQDPICGKPFPPPIQAKRNGGKIRYVQYTDETFQSKVIETPRLGILGPVLRGMVGEYLAVTFLNRGTRPLSMHPHGVRYDKDSEGSYYQPRPGLGAAVAHGAKFTYVWHLDEHSGPLPGEPASKGWLYHSHVDGDEEAGLGLVGFIAVTDPKRARPDGTPNDTDREMAALFMLHDESGVGAAAREAAEYGAVGMNVPTLTWTQVQEQTEQGIRSAINGFIFGNARSRDERGRARALVSFCARLRAGFPHRALARLARGGGRTPAHRCGGTAAREHEGGGHGRGQSRRMAVPLPCRRPHDGRDVRPRDRASEHRHRRQP